MPGVTRTVVGYTGGKASHPTYASVCAGDGHTEAIRIEWDPRRTSYAAMLDVFRDNYTGGCHCLQYRSAIWFHSPQQQALAEAFLNDLNRGRRHVQLDIEPATTWWNAELYHQKYQKRSIMTLGLWAIMGSFCTIGGMVSFAAKSGLKSLKHKL